LTAFFTVVVWRRHYAVVAAAVGVARALSQAVARVASLERAR
jgi:hypothetical protein